MFPLTPFIRRLARCWRLRSFAYKVVCRESLCDFFENPEQAKFVHDILRGDDDIQVFDVSINHLLFKLHPAIVAWFDERDIEYQAEFELQEKFRENRKDQLTFSFNNELTAIQFKLTFL